MDPKTNAFMDIRNLSVDASPSIGPCLSVTEEKIPISVEVVRDLEVDMDVYEKVSLVFLLYPDIDLALQRLLAVEASLMSNQSSVSEVCLLSDWARTSIRDTGKNVSEDSASLPYEKQSAFVEALCIVQDFRSLARIRYGDRSTGLIVREMSLKTPEKYFINHTRNVLYRICESLSPPTAVDLVKQVERERLDLVRSFPPDPRLMEVVLLYWASHRFIDIVDNVHIDVRNLSRHLLMLGEIGLAKMLHTQCPYTAVPVQDMDMKLTGRPEESAQNFKPEKVPDNGGEKGGSSMSIVTDDYAPNMEMERTEIQNNTDTQKEVLRVAVAKKSAAERMECYKIDPKNMGICLIINQKNFYTESDSCLQRYLPMKPLEDRLGTDVDRDRLVEAFTSLGFDIKVLSNLTHHQLLEEARHTAAREVKKNHSCFVLCVLSHGQKDVVYGCNSIPVDIMDLVEIFCGSKCPPLIGKPKIFIFQACQGSKLQLTPVSDIAKDSPNSGLSGVKDYVKFLSTVPGYASLRHKITGSWFIEKLYEEIMCREPNSSLLDVFTLVNASLDKKSSVLNNSLISMMSELHSTLRGPVILPLEPEAMKKAQILAVQRLVFDELFKEFYANPKKCKEVMKKIHKS